jgi:hypothetical protein
MPTDSCSVALCERSAASRGWCHAHYMRWYETGDVRADEPLTRYVRGAESQFRTYTDEAGPTPANRPDLGPCWVWTGRTTSLGYGYLREGGREVPAHRWAYEHFIGPIPDGLEPDHLCRNRACVNYARHLELVTHQINTLRGESPPAQFARREACKAGHRFTPENTFARSDGGRGCRTCDRARSRASYLKRKARAAS